LEVEIINTWIVNAGAGRYKNFMSGLMATVVIISFTDLTENISFLYPFPQGGAVLIIAWPVKG